MELINWGLISHPYNWIIVVLMLAIGVFALHLVNDAMNGLNPLQPGS